MESIKINNYTKSKSRTNTTSFVANVFSGKYAPSRNYYRYGKSEQGRLDLKKVKQSAEAFLNQTDLSSSAIRIRGLKSGLFSVEKVI